MRAKVAEMRAAKGGKGKGKGKKGGKVFSKGGKSKDAVSSGRVDKSSSGGQQEKHYCNAKNCWNEVSWSKNDGKYFVKCYPCNKRGTKQSQHAMSAAVPLAAARKARNSCKGFATCLQSRNPFRALMAVSELRPLTVSPKICHLILG